MICRFTAASGLLKVVISEYWNPILWSIPPPTRSIFLSQIQLLVHQLKERLKSSGITYAMLAEKLGISEPTLKRWFSKNTFTIKQLEDICNAMGISFTEIFQVQPHRATNFLTGEQELELSSDEMLFQTFYLVISGAKPKTVTKHLKITAQQVSRLLYRLDLLGLIELHPGEKIIPLVTPNVRWLPNGLLQLKYGAMIRTDFMNSRFDGEDECDWFTTGKISRPSLELFNRKLSALISELDQFIALEKEVPMSGSAQITFFAAYRSWQVPFLKNQP